MRANIYGIIPSTEVLIEKKNGSGYDGMFAFQRGQF